MRALVAGAGFVGMALARRLSAEGHNVFVLKRSEIPGEAGIVAIRGGLREPSSLVGIPDDIEVVFFTAGADERTDEGYRRTYVEGITHLLRAPALVRRPPRRVLFTSSTAVYAQTNGEWVDESSPAEPTHFTGCRMLEAERRLHDLAPSSVALRCSGIYGPGRGRLLGRLQRGEVTYRSGHYTNRIHRDDVVGALAHLAAHDDPAPVYVASDHDPAEQRVVYQWLAERLGAPRPTESTAPHDARATNKRCRSDAIVEAGVSLRYPTFREGYAEIVGAHRPDPHTT